MTDTKHKNLYEKGNNFEMERINPIGTRNREKKTRVGFEPTTFRLLIINRCNYRGFG